MDSMKETYTTGRTDFTAASQETVIGEKDCRKFEKNQNFVRCRKRKQNAMKWERHRQQTKVGLRKLSVIAENVEGEHKIDSWYE